MSTELHTIVLKSRGHHDEGVAGSAILPGEAIRLAATGGKYNVEPLALAVHVLRGGFKIAKECALLGKTTADAYALDDVLFFYTPLSGDNVQVLVKTGAELVIGSTLVVEGGGSGLFVKAGALAAGQLEALEDSGGALAADTLIVCRVL